MDASPCISALSTTSASALKPWHVMVTLVCLLVVVAVVLVAVLLVRAGGRRR